MDDKTDAAIAAASAPAQPEFTYVFLLADWGGRLEGSVLRAGVELKGTLDVEGVKYREASDLERGLAGFPA